MPPISRTGIQYSVKRIDSCGPEEAVGLLVAEEAGLHLHVGALVVGERLAPVEAVGVAAPGPDLLRGRVLGRRVVDDPGSVRGW